MTSEIVGHEMSPAKQPMDCSALSTSVFLNHGADDAWVFVVFGRQASRILRRIMVRVEWHEFTGAEGDGHWIKETDGFDQILQFLGT
jgi:predicted esterase